MWLNIKINNLFKIIIAVLLVISFTVSVVSCKEAPVAEETEKQVEEPSEESPPEAVEEEEETPPMVEEKVTEPTEWEGVKIPLIEGLRFEEGIFFAGASNPYGLEAGEKAGVFVKDAVEINGVMESFIGLRPEVIKVVQKKKVEENEEFGYPFFIDLESARGIKIEEREDPNMDDFLKSKSVFWDNSKDLIITGIPLGTRIYSPLETSEFFIWDNNHGEISEDGLTRYALSFVTYRSEFNKGNFMFKNENFDIADVRIGTIGIKLLPSGIENNFVKNFLGGYSVLTEAKLGDPIAEISSEKYGSVTSFCEVRQLKDKNKKTEFLLEMPLSDSLKVLRVSLAGFLKVEEIPIFISSAHE